MPETTDESKRDRRTAKRILAIGLPLVIIAGTGIGYAFWTGGGGGTGTASTATATTALTVATVSAPTNMAPGIPAAGISVSVSNPAAAASSAHISQVVVAITSVTGGLGSCSAADYTLTPPSGIMSTGGPVDIAPGASAPFSGVTLGFFNSAVNQDGCKGATVNLGYTAS